MKLPPSLLTLALSCFALLPISDFIRFLNRQCPDYWARGSPACAQHPGRTRRGAPTPEETNPGCTRPIACSTPKGRARAGTSARSERHGVPRGHVVGSYDSQGGHYLPKRVVAEKQGARAGPEFKTDRTLSTRVQPTRVAQRPSCPPLPRVPPDSCSGQRAPPGGTRAPNRPLPQGCCPTLP